MTVSLKLRSISTRQKCAESTYISFKQTSIYSIRSYILNHSPQNVVIAFLYLKQDLVQLCQFTYPCQHLSQHSKKYFLSHMTLIFAFFYADLIYHKAATPRGADNNTPEVQSNCPAIFLASMRVTFLFLGALINELFFSR